MGTRMLSVFMVVAAAGSAFAQDISTVNSFQMEARKFNDFGSSTLTINGVNRPIQETYGLPLGTLDIDEQFPQGVAGNFANKHVGWLSNDGGATRFQTNVHQSWTMNFSVFMSANSATPRKEAGIEIHTPRPGLGYTDEGQVLIASDNGEVAVFGATMPFTGFGTGCYTLGTTAQVTFEFFAPGVVDPSKGAYRLRFLDAVTGLHDSGLKLWGVEPDGIAGFDNAYIGLKDQNQRNPFVADGAHVVYDGVSIVPAPGAVAMLGLAGLAAARRRR